MTGLIKSLPRRIGEIFYNQQPVYSPEITDFPLHLPGLVSIIDPETGEPRLVTGGEGTFEQVQAPTGRYEQTGTTKSPSKLSQGLMEGVQRAIAGVGTPNIAGGGATDIFRSLAAGDAAVRAEQDSQAARAEKQRQLDIDRIRAEGELAMRKKQLALEEEQLERMKASGRPSLKDNYIATGGILLHIPTGKIIKPPAEPTVLLKADVVKKHGYSGKENSDGDVEVPISLAKAWSTQEAKPKAVTPETPQEAVDRRIAMAPSLGLNAFTPEWKEFVIDGNYSAPSAAKPAAVPMTAEELVQNEAIYKQSRESVKSYYDSIDWSQYFYEVEDPKTKVKSWAIRADLRDEYFKLRGEERKAAQDIEKGWADLMGKATKKPSMAKNVDQEVSDHRDEFLQDKNLLPRKELGVKPIEQEEKEPTGEDYLRKYRAEHYKSPKVSSSPIFRPQGR